MPLAVVCGLGLEDKALVLGLGLGLGLVLFGLGLEGTGRVQCSHHCLQFVL